MKNKMKKENLKQKKVKDAIRGSIASSSRFEWL